MAIVIQGSTEKKPDLSRSMPSTCGQQWLCSAPDWRHLSCKTSQHVLTSAPARQQGDQLSACSPIQLAAAAVTSFVASRSQCSAQAEQ